jgi:hypothetical protein
MVEYLSGNRIQGSSTFSSSPPQTSWKEIGRTTLGSDGDTIDVTGFAVKDNLMILNHIIPSGVVQWELGLGSAGSIDTGNNYATRIQRNGSELTRTSQDTIESEKDAAEDQFVVLNLNNVSAQEKLCVGNVMLAGTSGAGNAPNRCEIAGKWANTSAQINSVRIGNAGGGDMASGSEVVILGCDNDEADSGTNFWQELASVDTSSSHDVIDTGTFTNKKYLWLQCYVKGGSNASGSWIFNDDTNQTGYAIRRSNNGGADTGQYAGNNPAGSEGAYDGWGATGAGKYYNMFIVNNGANEALWINHLTIGDSAGAGNAPNRNEVVGKWDLTDAITRIRIKNQDSGSDYDESSIKVWGSD